MDCLLDYKLLVNLFKKVLCCRLGKHLNHPLTFINTIPIYLS